ncbi:MAG: DNA gyrase inhibitor YacG [Hyphomicrobiaceae bacterium]
MNDVDLPPAKPQGRCPICAKPREPKYQPFCSKRCADVDLARWLGGNYVIAGGKEDADEDGDDALAGRTTTSAAQDKIDENE